MLATGPGRRRPARSLEKSQPSSSGACDAVPSDSQSLCVTARHSTELEARRRRTYTDDCRAQRQRKPSEIGQQLEDATERRGQKRHANRPGRNSLVRRQLSVEVGKALVDRRRGGRSRGIRFLSKGSPDDARAVVECGAERNLCVSARPERTLEGCCIGWQQAP